MQTTSLNHGDPALDKQSRKDGWMMMEGVYTVNESTHDYLEFLSVTGSINGSCYFSVKMM